MSDIEYIEIPLETDPEELSQESFDYLQAHIAGWLPNDANLETIFIEAVARLTAEARDIASAAPTDIFRFYGGLVGIDPQEETFATTTVTFTAIDNVGYTIPGGTQIGIRVTGDDLVIFETVADAVIPVGSTTVTPVGVQAADAGASANGLSATLPAEMVDTLAFILSVDTLADTSGGTEAESTTDYLTRLSARLTLMADRPILPQDFAILATDIPGVERAIALDGYNPNHNLLTVNQSSLETDTSGWAVGTNCAITRDTAQHSDGGAALKLTSSAGGTMTAVTTPITTYAATPGQQVNALADFRAQTAARSCRVNLAWYTSGSVLISTTNGSLVSDSTSAWTQASVTGNAPLTTAYVVVTVEVQSTAGALEGHYVDRIALKHYTGGAWGIGGTLENGNERMVAVFPVDENGLAVSSGIKTQVDTYLQSLREVTFVVTVNDPTYTSIDVTFGAKAVTGFVLTDVELAAEQAVRDYLSPQNWGLPQSQNISTGDRLSQKWNQATVIRLYELTTVINNVPGIDYVSTITFGRTGGSLGTTDFTLDGPAPLPLAGTINGTIT